MRASHAGAAAAAALVAGILAGCGQGAPTPAPGEGAVGFVNQEGAGAAGLYPPPNNADGGPSGQTPGTGAAAAPSQIQSTSPGAGR